MAIDNELKKAIKDDNLVIFAGAGTSIPLGLPSWKSFVLKVIDEVKTQDEAYAHFEELINKGILTPLAVLENLQKVKRYKKLILSTLKKELKSVKKPYDFELQKKILTLSKRVVTTNYDRAFELASFNTNVILKDEKSHLANMFEKQEFLWKIHGDILKATQCILFEEQYRKLYNRESAFLLGLKILFVQKTILFVGFSLTDPYIEEIIKAMDELYDFHRRKPFVITTKGSFIENKYGNSIKCIPIKDNEDLASKLDVYIKYKEEGIDTSLEATPVSRSYPKLIGRKQQLEEIMERIREPYPVTIIQGLPGVGKTSLAIEIAHICLNDSNFEISNPKIFKHVIWISLGTYSTEQDLLYCILEEIGRQTDYSTITRTSNKLQKKQQAELLLKEQELLIILDNFEIVENEALDVWIRDIPSGIKSEILITTQHDPRFSQASYTLTGFKEKDSIEFMRQEAKSQEVQLGRFNSEENLRKLHEAAEGNPQYMKLAIGFIKQGELRLSDLAETSEKLKSIFTVGYVKQWNKLSGNARSILLIFTLFKHKTHIHRDALRYACGQQKTEFNYALSEIYDWNLFVVEIENQIYSIHSSLFIFLNKVKSKTEKGNRSIPEQHVKERFIQYYVNYLECTIVRKEPGEKYWNSLVSEQMDPLESQWSSILQALYWAKEITAQNENFLTLVLLLVHYMDSRSFNRERIEFVRRAVEICKSKGFKYFEALFQIDALGWTLIEENNLQDAEKCIRDGMNIVQSDLHDDEYKELDSLGGAWLARVTIEQGKMPEALKLIEKIKDYNGKPWIKSRIFQAAGDVFYKVEEYKKALKYYLVAEEESFKYGGEGNSYRMSPRVGLAYLTNNELDKAESIFKSLINDNTQIKINELYGRYGLALLEYEKPEKTTRAGERSQKANRKLNDIESEIKKRSSSNILLNLMNQYRRKFTRLNHA